MQVEGRSIYLTTEKHIPSGRKAYTRHALGIYPAAGDLGGGEGEESEGRSGGRKEGEGAFEGMNLHRSGEGEKFLWGGISLCKKELD